jgi:glycosyltransferase involved in cell wall biosynthesis
MKSMIVLVNNEFDSDPRVNRSVTASRKYFDSITVLSGVPQFEDRKTTCLGNVTVLRHYYYKPNFSKSSLVKNALSVAMGSNQPKSDDVEGGRPQQSIFRTLLFIGWFGYMFVMNLWIFLRRSPQRADIYYANDYDTLLAAFLMSKIWHGVLIYDSHELYSDMLEDSPPIYKRLIEYFEGVLSRKASVVITVNNPIAKILESRYRLSKTPEVVYNTPYYQKVDGDSPAPTVPYKLLYHGMYLPGRNLDTLVVSMRDVENFHLYFRGYGTLQETLYNLVQQLGLENKVTFLEQVSMKELVSSAQEYDMGIIPYPGSQKQLNSYYCTPNKIFEYMMAGLALAVSDLPVLREIVKANQVGVVFDPSSPTQMAATLNQITQQDLVTMKANSLMAARETFNFDQESTKLIKIYQDLYQEN